MIVRRALAIAATALAAMSAAPRAAPSPLVAAASSLREIVRDAVAAAPVAWDTTVGGSGVLARQIERGAPVAVFLSASPEEIDALAREGRIVSGSSRDLAANALILIAPPGSRPPDGLVDLAAPDVNRVALANPRTAPAGRYTREALVAAGLLDRVEPRAVYGESVRQVLEYVSRGDADLGVVYASDVRAFVDRVTAGATVPAELHAPIRVRGAAIAASGREEHARALLDWLASDAGRAAFARHGFAPLPAERAP